MGNSGDNKISSGTGEGSKRSRIDYVNRPPSTGNDGYDRGKRIKLSSQDQKT